MSGALPTWRLASRLAHREVRRRPGRTALVMLLVALPVFAMTLASVLYRTTHDPHDEQHRRRNGDSDIAIGTGFVGSVEQASTAELLAMLPVGSRLVEVHTIDWAPIRARGSDDTTRVRFTDLPLDDALTDGIVDVQHGRPPEADREVLLSGGVADSLGVGVGDELTLENPDATFRVVGIGRLNDHFDQPLMVVRGFDFGSVRDDAVSHSWLGDVPGGASAELVRRLSETTQTDVSSPLFTVYESSDDVTPGTALAWGWVAGALALTVMGVIICAAFATSARRQLVTLGQLSANGAGQRLLRRTLSLQGAWSGVLGSLLGIALAVGAVLAWRGSIEDRIVQQDIGGYVFSPFDLVVIMLTGVVAASVAAFIPARTITRVPALTALAGRRPLGTVPRRLVPTGVALFGGGVFLLLLVATMSSSSSGDGSDANLYAATAILGGLGVLVGMCCLTPAIVAVLGPIGERLGGAGRLAARSLARARTRSAAVVTAVAAAGALSVAVGAAVASQTSAAAADDLAASRDTVVVQTFSWAEEPVLSKEAFIEPAPVLLPVSADVQDSLLAAVPDSRLSPLRYATYEPAREPSGPVSLSPDVVPVLGNRFLIADPHVVSTLGLNDGDIEALEAGRVLSVLPRDFIDGIETVELPTRTGSIRIEIAPMTTPTRSTLLLGGQLMSEDQALRLGLTIGQSGVLLEATHDLTDIEREAVARIAERNGDQSNPFAPAAQQSPNVVYYNFDFNHPEGWSPSRTVINTAIVLATLLLTLGVVAVGMALSAAESREEREVLLAVGAKPSAMRRVAAIKTTLLAALGGALAVPTGFIPVAVVIGQSTGRDKLTFPWMVAAGIVLAVPLIVGTCGLIGAAGAQRIRPVRMSTLAAD